MTVQEEGGLYATPSPTHQNCVRHVSCLKSNYRCHPLPHPHAGGCVLAAEGGLVSFLER